ncbi:hypothetical protein CCMSSC00406_0008209 [Pleurotus cornucopiae]|uniref:Uncharacterized protein n=1 Tax=Pleurotus cornucopiae TaxID=5321 RepID=A0ACB7IN50_PLECO|nr:hypothetical protein CCMSSC00406_0008209 [Pleurotus cornucopiae]
MAAAAIWLARLALGLEQWTPNLAHYSSYAESGLIPTANLMLNYILKTTDHESFHKKYASKRFLKSSVYMREWALEKWQENCRVNLKEERPALNEQIWEARLEAEALEGAHETVEYVEREDVDASRSKASQRLDKTFITCILLLF